MFNKIQSVFVVWVAVGLLVLAPSQVAWACSFGPPDSLNQTIETVDYIVKATIVQVDDASVNAILEAETYLTGGSGPERLLLSRGGPFLISISYEHHYDTGCSGVGPIDLGTSAYFAVRRAENGAYFMPFSPAFYALEFSDHPRTFLSVRINPEGEDIEENLQRLEITSEQEFIDLVAQLSGESPAAPQEPRQVTSRFPLLAPLLITTENGTQYIFPVDGRELGERDEAVPLQPEWSPVAYPSLFNLPLFCAAVDCQVWTPDRSLYGVQVDENTIHFDYGWLDEPLVVEGQAFAFSPTSEALLVWSDNALKIILISNRGCDPDECVSGGWPWLVEIASLTLNINADAASLHGLAMWSADGTTLTYGDADGVWVFDIYHQSAPELVVPSNREAIPSPLFLSSTGRYLAYTWDRAGDDWLTRERMSGQEFENAIISPNERYMTQIAPPNPEPRPDVAGCNVPMMYDCRYILWDSPRYFAWVGEQSYVVSRCTDGNDECRLWGYEMSNLTLPRQGDAPLAREYSGWLGDIDYQPNQRLLAFVIAPQTIALGSESMDFDLSDQLDGAIADIEWLPSLFYFR